MRYLLSFVAIVASFAVAVPRVSAAPSDPIAQRGGMWSSDGTRAASFSVGGGAPAPSFAAADFGKDGVTEFVVGAGVGEQPVVRVLRPDGSQIVGVLAFDAKMTRGVTAVPADVNGDGHREIVVAAGVRAAGEVRVLDLEGKVVAGTKPFFPYGKAFVGGIALTAGDLDGDGKDEIVTAPLAGAKADVAVWRADGTKVGGFAAFDAAFKGGSALAVGDVTGDGKADIVVATASAGNMVRTFDGTTFAKLREFVAIDPKFGGGFSVAVGDTDGDGARDIVIAPSNAGGPHLFVYAADGTKRSDFFVDDKKYRGGVLVAVGTFAANAPSRIATLLSQPTGVQPQVKKLIMVDLGEQRLRAYENGVLVRTFLVSTGKVGPTPQGKFRVEAMPYHVYYAGPGYDLGLVPFNLRFFPRHYIHYAYWHNNFGAPMSHGCVNVDRPNAEWIYGWGEVGAPVEVAA
jgi:lipoprotein-anchoring transpeptidase ErfK/SrfK